MNTDVINLGAALDEAMRALTPISPTARLDAEVLLMQVCNFTRTDLIRRVNEALDLERYRDYQRLIVRRYAGEPVAYIVGVREFWSLPFVVTPVVLIPRAETELLVERALDHIPRDSGSAVADLGTGSGAVALAIASERPLSQLSAIDISSAALDIARENAHRLRITNVAFELRDWLTPSSPQRFDVIVSNPPYLRAGDPHLEQGDVRYEPRIALVGGVDGLDAIRDIARQARERLHPGGWLLFEHGYDQAPFVAEILCAAGFSEPHCYPDLAGRPRVTQARNANPL